MNDNAAVCIRMPFKAKKHRLCGGVGRAMLVVLFAVAVFPSPSQARDQDAEQFMKQMAHEHRQEERRREREAREQEQRVRELQAEQAKAASGKNIGFSSGSSSTSSVSSSSDKGSGSSSTSNSYNKSNTNAQSANTRAVVNPSTEPPRTVAKWLEQLSAPKVQAPAVVVTPPKAVTAAAAATAEKAKAAATDAQAQKSAAEKTIRAVTQAAKPVTKTVGGKPTGGAPGKIEFLDVPLPEVLAVNATAATVARAKSLGFTATPATSLAALNMSVTRLLPPQGMSPSDAQALLRTQLPGASFAPNVKYRIYKTAAGGLSPTPSGVPATPSATTAQTCGADRCFAQNVIGWKPELRKCASGLKVGIIDTSVDISHPTFKRKQIEVRHFGPKDKPGPDWHGTGVAALLAGDDKSSTPGLIPDASFYVADIFYAGEDKGPASDTLSMLRAFNWLEASGVKIINMSLSGPPDALIEEAVAKLSANGILLVAAAGNEGPNNAGPSYPAAYDDVIAVTAVNKNLQNYRYANRGTYVDVAAPGVAIWTALPGSQNGYHSGTSFATPYVTASLAAIYPRAGQKPSAALQSLSFRDLGEAGVDPVYGRGLLMAPQSCTGGQIASAPQPTTDALTDEPAPFFSLFAPSSAPAKNVEHNEELPWLSLGGAQQ